MPVSWEQREELTGECRSYLSGAERKSEQGKASWVLKETVWEACKLEQPRNWHNGEGGEKSQEASPSPGPLVCITNDRMLIGTQIPNLSR